MHSEVPSGNRNGITNERRGTAGPQQHSRISVRQRVGHMFTGLHAVHLVIGMIVLERLLRLAGNRRSAP
jgi:hypothetical protein